MAPVNMETDDGETAMLVRIGLAVTVVLTVVVWGVEPLVPVIVTDAVPTVAVGAAVKVSVLVAVPEIEVGLKVAVTPLGKFEAVRATLPLKPPVLVRLIVVVWLAPCAILRLAGLTDTLKSEAGLTVAPWSMPTKSPLPVALPAIFAGVMGYSGNHGP